MRSRVGLALVMLASTLPGAGDATAQPLRTAFVDPVVLAGPEAEQALRRARSSGATFIRIVASWRDVAPAQRLPGFRADDPNDPAYRWDVLDAQVRLAANAGLTPIVNLLLAPDWAEDPSVTGPAGVRQPDPGEFALFARAAARRYAGGSGLPRVRYWQAWNEPNLDLFWLPQFVGADAVSPEWYRSLVNAFADAVHEVDSRNLVVAGGLSPFGAQNRAVGPLRFMRELLCMSGGRSPRPTCSARVRFDIWAHHPYTSGGPTHQANAPDDVSLGDLPEMRSLLVAAKRAGRIDSPRMPEFWVTEFSWDSRPPDPKGVPAALQARWVAEAMYRMWASGVSLVTWFSLRDQPISQSFFQSSLFYRGSTIEADRPKPSHRAFRFPLVALPQGRKVLVWGKAPGEQRVRVTIEQSFAGGWRVLGVVRTDTAGIFRRVFATPRLGAVRATVAGRSERSRAFALKGVRDGAYTPFGD